MSAHTTPSRIFGALVLIFALLPALRAQAAFTYTTEAAFLAAAGPVNYEDFEDESVLGTPNGTTKASSIAFDYFTATASSAILGLYDTADLGNGNVVPVDGTKYLAVNGSFTTESVQLLFSQPIRSLGFYYRDINNAGPGLVQVTIPNVPAFSLDGGGGDGILYFGVIADAPFSSVTIGTTIEDSFWSIDGVATSVPEASSATLAAFALACGARLRRHRTRAA